MIFLNFSQHRLGSDQICFDPKRFDPRRFDPGRFDPRRYDPRRFDPRRFFPICFDPICLTSNDPIGFVCAPSLTCGLAQKDLKINILHSMIVGSFLQLFNVNDLFPFDHLNPRDDQAAG
jgi:hypothetical protein